MIQPGLMQLTAVGDREIHITRSFDAPRQLVYDAFRKAELLKRWFTGPPGWTLTVCEPGEKAGDAYRYVWRSPDGMEMGLGGIVLELEPPERMVATEKFEQSWYPGGAVGTIVLTEHEGKTLMRQTVVYDSSEAREIALKSPMEQGMAMGYNSLAAMLATLV